MSLRIIFLILQRIIYRLESKRTDRSLLPKQILATESQESPNLPTGTLNSGTEVKIEPVIKQENRPMVKEIRKPVMEQKIGPISSVSQFQSETLPKTEEKLTQNVNTQKISNSKPFMNTTQFHMGNVSKIEGPEAKLTQNINTHKLSNSSIGDGDSKGKVNALLQPEVIEKLASLELPALPEEVLEDGHGETQVEFKISNLDLEPQKNSELEISISRHRTEYLKIMTKHALWKQATYFSLEPYHLRSLCFDYFLKGDTGASKIAFDLHSGIFYAIVSLI